jgi:hypothetical protein
MGVFLSSDEVTSAPTEPEASEDCADPVRHEFSSRRLQAAARLIAERGDRTRRFFPVETIWRRCTTNENEPHTK